ncbi:MAG: hypothetical protein WCF23_01800 [Candidatus Nitrosopolaris sp.]
MNAICPPIGDKAIGGYCKGICTRYKALRPIDADGARYIVGQKRCQICDLFLNQDSLYCPCHFKLRTKPRLGEARARLKLALAK